MSFLRTAVLAVGMMGLVACGGSSDSGSTTPAANPCGETEMNPCGEGGDTEANPCGDMPCGEEMPCGDENPCGEEMPCGDDMPCGDE